MGVAKLYKVKEEMNRLDKLSKEISKCLIAIHKEKKLTRQIARSVTGCTTLSALELVTAPYMPAKQGSTLQKARSQGLESVAYALLAGAPVLPGEKVRVQSDQGKVECVELAGKWNLVDAVVSDIVKTSREVVDCCENILRFQRRQIIMAVEKSKSKEAEASGEKFSHYYKMRKSVADLQPFEVMAINRGEKLKALSVTVTLPTVAAGKLEEACRGAMASLQHPATQGRVLKLTNTSLRGYIVRRIRSQLKEVAVGASVGVFSENLRHLLLGPPLHGGRRVLAVDPSYKHGCKLAAIDGAGEVLGTATVHLNAKAKEFENPRVFEELHRKHRYNVIAIGNGTACRETEQAVAKVIKRLGGSVQYTVVEERGASVYSCSDAAATELPDIPMIHRSAVSIGRRLLDPLSEYVKIDPQALGVGQYQHDLPATQLNSRLTDTVVECVSFTGVDVNTCSQALLQRIAGLNTTTASNIVQRRRDIGPFTNRQQILKVKGVGPKRFEQCIGFLRIYQHCDQSQNETAEETEVSKVGSKRKKKTVEGPGKKRKTEERNFLDQTSVHPECYELADQIILEAGLSKEDIGTSHFTERIKAIDPGRYGSPAAHVLASLSQPLTYDYRSQFSSALLRSAADTAALAVGAVREGRVTNVTQFGAFVDVAGPRDGLLHRSKLGGRSVVLGQRLTVKVERMDQKGIGLVLAGPLT